jgi:hypothetical protein
MDLNKRMENMSGGVQGEQPSIKEQIEQKAGLMAANTMQQQQQQQQQQMAMAGRPGPAPAGVPQPEPQPQAPFMAARGGLASVPVNFAFKPGGIVGYSGETGSQVKSEEEMAIEQAAAARAALRTYGLAKMKEDPEGFKAAQETARAADERVAALSSQASGGAAGAMGRTFERTAPTLPAPAQQAPAPRPASVSEAQATAMAGPQAAVPPRVQRPVPPAQPARPAAQAEQPMQTGLPAAASRSPYFAQADADIAKPIAAPTTQSIIDEQRALSPQALLEENMRKRYEERKGRADQERATFEKTRPSGLDDLIRIYGQSAQYKGGTGLGPAYTANQDRKRAEEMALEKRMNELYTAADTQEYEGAKEIYGARAKSMDAANRSYQERLKAKTETLAQLANTDQRSIDAALNRLNEVQIQQMRMAQSKADAARPGEGERFAAKYLGMIAAGDTKGAEAYKDAFLIGKKGEPREDTQAKKIAEERVRIATSLMDPKTKQTQLAALDALEKGMTGGGNAGKVPPPPPGFTPDKP